MQLLDALEFLSEEFTPERMRHLSRNIPDTAVCQQCWSVLACWRILKRLRQIRVQLEPASRLVSSEGSLKELTYLKGGELQWTLYSVHECE